MAETARFTIGADVHCGNEKCGRVERVVVDPVARKLTHLAIDAGGRGKLLVPVRLVEDSGEPVRLSCTTDELKDLEPAVETQFLPGVEDDLGYGPGQALAWPYYPLTVGGTGIGGPVVRRAPVSGPRAVTYDRIPRGGTDLRRGDRVQAADGEIGRVEGLVVDPEDHGVTHVLLQEGHLWGRKTVAIPIGAVTRVEGELKVRLSKQEIGELPPVELARDR